MLLKQCRKCGAYIQYPATYCSKCLLIVEEERAINRANAKSLADARYNKTRDKKYLRFYNSPEWRHLSNQYMVDVGYKCEMCHKIATEVHHVVPIQTEEGWLRRLDYTNLMALCVNCHNKKHCRFKTNKSNDKCR
mgnify:CR=1 FL=1